MERISSIFFVAALTATLAHGWQESENSSQPPRSAYRVGSGVSAPSVLSKRDPGYTEAARREKVAGTVLLHLIVGSDGVAHDIKVARSLGYGLDELAVDCVKDWEFNPGKKNGVPVDVQATIEINFRVQEDPAKDAGVSLQ